MKTLVLLATLSLVLSNSQVITGLGVNPAGFIGNAFEASPSTFNRVTPPPYISSNQGPNGNRIVSPEVDI